MRIKRRSIDGEDREGEVRMIPEVYEDMWHAYNLISAGDFVLSQTVRKVVRQNQGNSSAEKMHITLKLEVERTDYDVETNTMRISGQNVEENEYVRMGQYHTIELAMNKEFTLQKISWSKIDIMRLDDAGNPGNSAEIAAIMIQPGRALLCIVTDYMTLVRCKIDCKVPTKRSDSSQALCRSRSGKSSSGNDLSSKRSLALSNFFDLVYDAALSNFNPESLKVILVGGPGFTPTDFLQHARNKAGTEKENTPSKAKKKKKQPSKSSKKSKNKNHDNDDDNDDNYKDASNAPIERPALFSNFDKFVCCHASSAKKTCVEEILSRPESREMIEHTRFATEISSISQFFRLLAHSPTMVAFGFKEVYLACSEQGVETLLISDSLWRSKDVKVRKQYSDLVDLARSSKIVTCSTMHVTGERLQKIGGIAAILYRPMIFDLLLGDAPDEVVDEKENEDEDDNFVYLDGDDWRNDLTLMDALISSRNNDSTVAVFHRRHDDDDDDENGTTDEAMESIAYMGLDSFMSNTNK